MKQRIPSRTLSIALALVLSLALLVAPPAGGPLSASASHGHEVAVQVSLVPGGTANYTVRGWLTETLANRPVILLTAGATESGIAYRNFPGSDFYLNEHGANGVSKGMRRRYSLVKYLRDVGYPSLRSTASAPATDWIFDLFQSADGYLGWIQKLDILLMRSLMRKEFPTLILLLLLSPPLVFAQQKQSSQPKALAFTNVTIIDVAARDSRRSLKPNQTVVVTGDRITAVGGNIRIPRGAQVIDASGKYLIPGLWDMNVLATVTVYPFYVVNGVTGVRDIGSPRPIAALLDIRKSAAEGRLVAPRMVATGRPLDGPFPGRRHHTPVANEVTARQGVVTLKQSGADFVAVFDMLPREAYFAVVDEAKRQSIPFAGSVPMSLNAAEVSNAGQQSIERVPTMLPSCSNRAEEIINKYAEVLRAPTARPQGFRVPWQTLLETYDTKRAAALFSLLAKNGTFVTPMLGHWANVHLDFEKDHKNDSRMKYLLPELKQYWASSQGVFEKEFEQTRESSKAVTQKFLEMVKAMNSAGVRLLAGSGTPGHPFEWPGFSLHEELEWLVKAGLTPLEALQAATLNPARFLGKEKELGTVERGKLADLVLLDDNPLADIRNTQRIAAVMSNGRYMDKSELQKMLSELEAAANKK